MQRRELQRKKSREKKKRNKKEKPLSKESKIWKPNSRRSEMRIKLR